MVHSRDRDVPTIPDYMDHPSVRVDLVYLVQASGVLGTLVSHDPLARSGDLFGQKVVYREPGKGAQILFVAVRPPVPGELVPYPELLGDRQRPGKARNWTRVDGYLFMVVVPPEKAPLLAAGYLWVSVQGPTEPGSSGAHLASYKKDLFVLPRSQAPSRARNGGRRSD